MVASGRIGTVLVVDDDQALLASFRRSIGPHYTALTASDGASARSQARQRAPDLMIVDLCLGRESGLEVVRTLKAEHPSAIIVLISGWASIEQAVAAVHAGADHVIAKPVTFAEILNRIQAKPIVSEELFVETPTLARAEWEHISRVISDCDGNLSLAARRLGVYRSTLQRRLRKYAPRS
jgi:two-component system response regulator RegA